MEDHLAPQTEQELAAWLHAAPPELATAVAQRAALRVLPFAFLIDAPSDEVNFQLLASLRAIMTAGVAAKMPGIVGPETTAKAAAFAAEMAEAGAANSADEGVDTMARAGVAYTAEAAARSITGGADTALEAVMLAAQTASAATAGFDDAYFSVLQGAFSDTELPPDELAHSPLQRPKVLVDVVDIYRTGRISLFPGGHFAFWSKWYDGAVTGAPISWDLQRLAVIIRDKYWRTGPDSVARHIEEARARMGVLTAIGMLEAALTGEGLDIDDDKTEKDGPDANFAAVKLIQEPLTGIKKQTQSVQPQPFLVGKAVQKLRAVEIGIGHWMGSTMDPKAKDYAKAIGKAGGMSTALWLNMHSHELSEAISAAENWTQTLN